MSDFKHWQDDGAPPDFERLLRAARSERPSSASVQRALVASGIVGVSSLASGAAASAAGATGKVMLVAMAKWFVVGVIGAGAVVVTAKVLEESATPALRSVPKHPAVRTRPVQPPAIAVAPPTASAPSASASRSQILPQIPQSTPTHEVPPVAPLDRTLPEEMALIDDAHSRLRAGNASAALKRARAYVQRFPAGRFAPEALFLVMKASEELGDPATAIGAARDIIRRFPNGAQVERARELLESQAVGGNP